MPEFIYKVKDSKGKTITGRKVASLGEDLIPELERKGFTIISIKEAAKEKSSLQKVSAVLTKGGKKVKTFELLILCRQLATMLHGGVPILDAIESISEEMKNQEFRGVLRSVSKDVRGGMSLSGSLKKYPRVFSTLFTAIIEAGEKVGALDEMLNRLASYLESRDRIIKKIRSATIYPAFIAGFFLFAITVVTLFLIPRFQSLYSDFGAQLPALTLFVFNVSSFFIKNIAFLLIIIVAASIFISLYIKQNKQGKMLIAGAILKLPVFGDVIKKAAISKFCRTLSTLLEQGIPVTEALRLVGETSGNIIIEDASKEAGKLNR